MPLREDAEPPLSQEVGVGDVRVNFIVDQLPLLPRPSMLPPQERLFWRNNPLPKPPSSFFLNGYGHELRWPSIALFSHPSRSGWRLISDKRGEGRGG